MNEATLLTALQKTEPWCWTHGLKFGAMRPFLLTDGQMRVLHARRGILRRYPYAWVTERYRTVAAPHVIYVRAAHAMVAFNRDIPSADADYAVAYAAALSDIQEKHMAWTAIPRDAETLGAIHTQRLRAIEAQVGEGVLRDYLMAARVLRPVASEPWQQAVLDTLHAEESRLAPARNIGLLTLGFSTFMARAITKMRTPFNELPRAAALGLALVTVAREAAPDEGA